MAIKRITEGITGAAAANIIYENDLENSQGLNALNAAVFEETGEDVTGPITNGGYHDFETGELVTATGYKFAKIQCSAGEIFDVAGFTFSASSTLISRFNNSDEYLGYVEKGTSDPKNYTRFRYVAEHDGYFFAHGREGGAYPLQVLKISTTGQVNFYNKDEAATKTELDSKQDKQDGNLETEAKEIVPAINELKTLTDEFFEDMYEDIPVVPVAGFYKFDNGVLTTGSYRSSQKIPVTGPRYILDGSISSAQTAFVVEWNPDGSYRGYKERGQGTRQFIRDYIYEPEAGVGSFATVAITSDVANLRVRKYEGVRTKSYTRQETDALFVKKSSASLKLGLKYDPESTSMAAARTFDAVGLTASPRIGTTGGASDFNNVYPFSEMRRVNLKRTPAGAMKVTIEGEVGFATDGSNGGVFLEVPIIREGRYLDEDGFYNMFMSRDEGDIHPAFIEDGKVLDKIYIACYEASILDGKITSRAGAMPLNNTLPQDMLNLARAEGFSLYDHRTVDLLTKLMWIEFGTINMPSIFGNGWSDMTQPDMTPAKTAIVSETATNRIILDATKYNTATLLANFKERTFPSANILICKGTHQNVIAYRKVVSVTSDATQLIVNFDGAPVDIDTDCYFGNAPQDTGIVDSLGYHTGRTNRPKVDEASTVLDIRKNPNRYRYIENVSGNVWHYLPDITFENGVPFISDSIKDYEFWKKTGSYRPVALQLPAQEVNEGDNWVHSFANDYFCKYLLGQTFGVGAYNQRSGAYYYMKHSSAVCTVNGGGFDHRERCNPATNRSWIEPTTSNVAWYLYGCRLIYKRV